MNKHTPGPWRLHGRCENFGLPHSLVSANTLIARVYSEAFKDVEQETANARLIAAAPALLEALRLIASAKARGFDMDYATGCAGAAIAKATGAPQ